MRRSPFALLYNLIALLFFLLSIGVIVVVIMKIAGRI